MNAPVKPSDVAGATRREVVVAATLASGALLVGCSPGDLLSVGAKSEFGAFGPFIRIDPNGVVTVVSKHIEFGQGNHAGLAAIVAEELDADWSKVRSVHGNADPAYADPVMKFNLTGGSSALRPLRQALQAAFPDTPQVEGDLFGGVAAGLAVSR